MPRNELLFILGDAILTEFKELIFSLFAKHRPQTFLGAILNINII